MFTRTTAAASETTGESLAELLSDPHCKHLLALLREEDRPIAVSTASRYIVGKMTDAPVEEVPGNVERRVQTWLHHGLLPTLDDRGIVDFDPERRTVALTDEAVLRPADDRPQRHDEPDSGSGC